MALMSHDGRAPGWERARGRTRHSGSAREDRIIHLNKHGDALKRAPVKSHTAPLTLSNNNNTHNDTVIITITTETIVIYSYNKNYNYNSNNNT